MSLPKRRVQFQDLQLNCRERGSEQSVFGMAEAPIDLGALVRLKIVAMVLHDPYGAGLAKHALGI